MLKLIFAFLMIVHGLIHLLGFTKAFNIGKSTPITSEISKPAGIFWLLTTLLFFVATVFFLMNKNGWWIVSLASVLFSQLLIYSAWQDAKYGSIANLIILIIIIIYKI